MTIFILLGLLVVLFILEANREFAKRMKAGKVGPGGVWVHWIMLTLFVVLTALTAYAMNLYGNYWDVLRCRRG
ncbi:MAG: hypothetical protein JW893_05045 [Candidatus Omnitrophica bacterium]|nr:hypothetical protein [Candidatus Omnitrophota bacterium]